ncbi:MAG: hypothetical protein A2521_00390 [Deltaproteobacteria bacterium RIFOXYD12_FULL_57_12]|nr:MAG: hypothetical protein A2521_00390 [Deltaproteobacteria bacterium RIFOXYD12_FULL_57_12]
MRQHILPKNYPGRCLTVLFLTLAMSSAGPDRCGAAAELQPPALRLQSPAVSGPTSEEIRLPIDPEEPSARSVGQTAGQAVDTGRLTLPDVIRQAILNNKDIRIYSYDPAKALQDLVAAKSVYDPSVFQTGNLTRTDRPIQSLLDNGDTDRDELLEHRWDLQAGVKQPLPTGGMLSVFMEANHLNSSSDLVIPNPQNTARLTAQVRQSLLKEIGDRSNQAKIKIASLYINKSAEEFRQRLTEVLENVTKTYWQLYYDRAALEIRQASLAKAEELQTREAGRLEQGIGSPLDLDRVRAKVETRRIDLLNAVNQVDATARQLSLLIGLPPATDSHKSPELVPVDQLKSTAVTIDRSTAIEKALLHRPELQAASDELRATEIKERLAQHRLLPRLDAKFSYTLNSLDEDLNRTVSDTFTSNTNSWVASVEFEYPFGNNQAEAEHRKSIYENRQAKTTLDKTREAVAMEVTLALSDLERFTKEIEITRRMETTMKQVVDRAETRFELAQINSDELLQFHDLLASAKSEKLRAQVNYNLKLLALNKAQGILPDELGIILEKSPAN